MKKLNNNLLLIVGFLLFIISYMLDQKINLLFKDLKYRFLDLIFGIITNFDIVIFISLIIPSIIFYNRNKKIVYLLWLSFIISFALAFIIKLIVSRPRSIGTFAYPFINVINYSFPSTHATVVFALLPILIKYLPKQKYFWLLFAFLVGLSRVYFGVHFLSDVVFGGFFGYFIGSYLLKLYEEKKLWR